MGGGLSAFLFLFLGGKGGQWEKDQNNYLWDGLWATYVEIIINGIT